MSFRMSKLQIQSLIKQEIKILKKVHSVQSKKHLLV